MPWVTINGEQKKVACGPCIRGHRSTSCNHKDRLLLEVRKPGRPLSSCPHVGGNCSCERLVINYTIPRSSECACPSNGEEPAPVAEVVSSTTGPLPSTSNRVQKTKRKSVSKSRNPATLEKAIKAAEDAEQKTKNEQPKSCCGPKQHPATVGSSNTSPAPTTGGSSPSSHDGGPSPSESTCCSSKPTSELETKPLNIQLEAHKESTGHSSSAQVQGWKHMTVDGTSAPKTIIEETPPSNCCGCGGDPANEAPRGPGIQRPTLPTPNGIHQQHQGQSANGVQSRIPTGQDHYGQLQQFQYYGAQQQFGNPIQGNTYSNATSNTINYASNGVSPGQYASFYPFGLGPQLSNGYENSVPDFMHNCTCGDACACLGCAVHPRNETTLRHLQEVANFMIQDPFYATPSSPPYNGDQIQYRPSYDVSETPSSSTANPGWQPSKMTQPYDQQPPFKHPGATYSQDMNGSSLWQHSNGSGAGSVHATPTTELSQFSFQDSRNGQVAAQRENQSFQSSQFQYQQTPSYNSSIRNTQFATPDPAPSTTTSETPTLSPSSFFWQQVELPGCDDASGACRCGDGCQCVGCLTHGGHDGVSLSQANGNFQNSSGFSPQLEQRRMNSIDITLDTKPGG